MILQTNLDALAERIQEGINRKGVHLIFPEELALLIDRKKARTDREQLMQIKSFAFRYEFEVRVNSSMKLALFKKMDVEFQRIRGALFGGEQNEAAAGRAAG